MRDAILAAIAVCGFATAASAGSALNVASDRPVYVVGQVITLKVGGDAQGERATGVYGCLVYSGSGKARPSTQTQKTIGANWGTGGIGNGTCPTDPYLQPRPECATGGFAFSDAFNQITPSDSQTSDALPAGYPASNLTLQLSAAVPQTSDALPLGNPFSTVTLIATAPGTVNVDWCSDLDWFSTSAGGNAGTSFTIVP